MRTRVVGLILASLLLPLTPAIAAAAGPPPAPPKIAPACETDKEYFWTVSTAVGGLADYDVDFTSVNTSDWAYPHGNQAELTSNGAGGHSVTISTSRADGTTVFVRWTSYPAQLASSSRVPVTACTPVSITVKRVVQGGSAAAGRFPVSIIHSTVNFADPPSMTQETTKVTSDAARTLRPGSYIVGPVKTSAGYAALPKGYLFRSSGCKGPAYATGTTTDAAYQRLTFWLNPGDKVVCTITYHYGPVLSDSIAAGRRTGATGFTTRAISVAKGTYITYLVKSSPSLAGRLLQIWTKRAGKAWRLTSTLKVATDGSVRYFAKVSAWTGFLAKWVGDAKYVGSSASGRYASVK